MENKNIVPENEEGKQVDLSRELIKQTKEEALQAYKTACERLLHPAAWKSLTGKLSADFSAADEYVKHGTVKEGDYIQIDIPGPGLSAGDGHDWVVVERLAKNPDPAADESLAMVVKVSTHPDHPEKGIAHFFADGASSTFMIKRKDKMITASYHGRNEKPNLENPDVTDKLRNAVVATGALMGISELQWTALIEGFLS